jgi:DNA-binding NarL/FixJ family response regulator
VAQAHHVRDLDVVGLALQGLAMTYGGDVAAGTELLDAAVAAATAGDVTDLMWMGKVCCWVIAACEETQDVARAGEWCLRVESICRARDLSPLFNVCRIQYASVQVARGTWAEAESELTAVLERLSSSRRTSRLEAVVQLGELRRRQGRFAEADALFVQAEFAPLAVLGRARIRFACGDAPSAWAAVSGLLRSLPPEGRLPRAAALFAAVHIAEAVGEHDAAVLAAGELRATAEQVSTGPLLAMAAAADGALAEPADAVILLREAVRRFQEAGLRYDEADARLHLARALLTVGDPAGAREQLDTAVPALTDLSAAAGLTEAVGLSAAAGGRGSGPLTPRELEVLRLVSQGMSNHDIAAALVLSEHTVHRHVANILTKLGQSSRAGAASYALSTGLLSLG